VLGQVHTRMLTPTIRATCVTGNCFTAYRWNIWNCSGLIRWRMDAIAAASVVCLHSSSQIFSRLIPAGSGRRSSVAVRSVASSCGG